MGILTQCTMPWRTAFFLIILAVPTMAWTSPFTITRSRQTINSTTRLYKSADSTEDWFQQRPGESDMEFFKRLTNSAPPKPKAKKTVESASNKGYQRIEDWEEEQQEKNGSMSWQERVQFDGQRFGNQVRQNDILMRQINSGL